MKKFMEIIDECDKELVGKEITDELILNKTKKEAISFTLCSSFPPKMLLETDLSYVCDKNGYRYIVPSVYDEALKDYDMEKAYFEDMAPVMYDVRFQTPNGFGVIYLILDMDAGEIILANKNAEEYIKYLDEKNLSSLIRTEYISTNPKPRKKGKRKYGR